MFLSKDFLKYSIIIVLFLLSDIILVSCSASSITQKKVPSLVLYTTTSVYDSGILDYLLPSFEKKSNLDVKVIAVGTGEALRNAELGNADLVFVHSPKLEKEYLKKGVLEKRREIAYNYFVIAGPDGDPAGVRQAQNASEAFQRIYKGKFSFCSRGDNSGTHLKELELWEAAGVDPKKNQNYVVTGSGMADTLRVASEKQAYVLTDIATLLTVKNLSIVPLFFKDENLKNIYSVCLISKKIIGEERYTASLKLFNYLTSKEPAQKIREFAKKHSKEGYPPVITPFIGDK